MGEDKYLNELKSTTEYTGVHPQKFALWLGMASMTMFFAALTSAMILKKGDFQSWENFRLPTVFIYGTAAIVVVSVLMHAALIAYRKASFSTFRALLTAGFLMAIVFLYCQYIGWSAMNAIGKSITGNISGQFVFLISYLHGFHIIIGLIVTLFFLFFAFRDRKNPVYEMNNTVNPKRLLHMELLVSFWHFIDIVWIYLYLFFYFNYQ